MPRIVLLLGVSAALLMGGCTAATDAAKTPATAGATGSTTPSSTTDIPSGIQPGYPTDVDQFAPLIITTIAPDPVPINGTDGKVHLAYELQVLNASPRPATITKLETLQDGPDGRVLATVSQEELVPLTILIGDLQAPSVPVEALPPGRTGLLVLDGVYASRSDVPAKVTHRITATFGDVPPGQAEFATRYPTAVTQVGGSVRTSTASAVIIGSPLAGNSWYTANGCCSPGPHRGALLSVGGRINPSERYAIDWVQLDLTGPSLVDQRSGRPLTFKGNDTVNEDYLAYGEPLLAVADGTVVAVSTEQSDAPPQTILPGLRLDQLGGNIITIDIGNGVFAFYAHAVPGPAKVKVGDRVTKGQVIGLLGNTGNSSEAHLHFHLTRAKLPLSGDNVAFEIEQLSYIGSPTADGRLDPGPTPGPRTNQYPVSDAVTDFPSAKP